MKPALTHFRPYFLLIVMALSACVPAVNSPAAPESRDTLYQVSSINSLMAGNYDGILSAEQVSKKGDFGIGTFEAVDGEMLMLNGVIYQVKDSGAVVTPSGTIKLPFTAVTYFDADLSQDVKTVQNLDGLKALLDPMLAKKDRFYAIKIDGIFDHVKVRSVPKQEKPYPVLSEVTKKQAVFEYQAVSGSLVGFWCPDYVGSVNVPGYHLHFISDDRTKGGHLLDVSFSKANVKLDETRFFEMELGESVQADSGVKDAQGEMDKVEK
jgi:acetolactate decarboxylase